MWLGETSTLLGECRGHSWQHAGNINGNRAREAWWTSWASIVWTLWNYINDIIFNQAGQDSRVVCRYQDIYRAWSWCIRL